MHGAQESWISCIAHPWFFWEKDGFCMIWMIKSPMHELLRIFYIDIVLNVILLISDSLGILHKKNMGLGGVWLGFGRSWLWSNFISRKQIEKPKEHLFLLLVSFAHSVLWCGLLSPCLIVKAEIVIRISSIQPRNYLPVDNGEPWWEWSLYRHQIQLPVGWANISH